MKSLLHAQRSAFAYQMGILSNSAGTVAICCLLASIMLALSACNEEQTAPQWRTADVVRTDLTRYATASGLTQAWKTVLIKSEASGEVKTIKVEVGDAVEQGALLVELDPIDAAEQLEKAKAETYVAKVGLTVAESQFKRSKDLLQRKVISRQDFEASELGLSLTN